MDSRTSEIQPYSLFILQSTEMGALLGRQMANNLKFNAEFKRRCKNADLKLLRVCIIAVILNYC